MKKITEHGQSCRHCESPVVYKESKFRLEKLAKPYFYEGFLKCPNCKAIYMLNSKKIEKKNYEAYLQAKIHKANMIQ